MGATNFYKINAKDTYVLIADDYEHDYELLCENEANFLEDNINNNLKIENISYFIKRKQNSEYRRNEIPTHPEELRNYPSRYLISVFSEFKDYNTFTENINGGKRNISVGEIEIDLFVVCGYYADACIDYFVSLHYLQDDAKITFESSVKDIFYQLLYASDFCREFYTIDIFKEKKRYLKNIYKMSVSIYDNMNIMRNAIEKSLQFYLIN